MLKVVPPPGTSGQPLSASDIVTITDITHTLSAADNGKVLYFTNASTISFFLSFGLGVAFSATIIQGGEGKITFLPGSTMLVSQSGKTHTLGQYAIVSLTSPVANTFVLAGPTGN